MNHPQLIRLPAAAADLRILFLAKHALSRGVPHAEDGAHAVYHHELLTTLRDLGLNVAAADSYTALFDRPDADFVIPLLNRGGFQNSEMLAPLLLHRHGLPYLGASPILRGVADDKHLTKVLARTHGVLTPPWAVYRRGAGPITPPPFSGDRLVVKPNASSASWGVRVTDDWADAAAHLKALQAQGHDVLVEAWTPLIDIAVPVVGGRNGPWILPAMAYRPADPYAVRTYEEKRNLGGGEVTEDPLEPVEDPGLNRTLSALVTRLMGDLWPFDYGRFEFRWDPHTGGVQFLEVNLSCNLWSKKTISRSARLLDVDHHALVGTILGHSLARYGLIAPAVHRVAA